MNDPSRHVVIVGAGHVGLEFLRLALSVSRNCAPSGSEPLSYRFDVFDNRSDPLHKGAGGQPECLAKHRFVAQTNGAYGLESLGCTFHLYDALGDAFLEKLDELDKVGEELGSITYVFFSLGDDFATAQVAMRIRERFESKR